MAKILAAKDKDLGRFLGKVKRAQLETGSDFMGSKGTVNCKESDIDAYDWGLKVTSKKSGRVFLIYGSNLRSTEMLNDSDSEE